MTVSIPASQDSRKGRAAALLQGQLPGTGYAVRGTFIWLFTQRSLLSLSAQIPGVMPTSLGVGGGGAAWGHQGLHATKLPSLHSLQGVDTVRK